MEAGLRFDPVGGGQFKQEVKQLIELEKAPIKALEARKSLEETKLKLFQEFKAKFTGFEKAINEVATFSKFRELKADLGDGSNTAAVTIDKEKAQPGTYQIQVDSMAARTSVITNGFEDPDQPILGLGFIVMNLGSGEQAEVFVDEEQSSLRGVANLINSEPASPIRAAVVKDAGNEESPWKIILSGKKDGKENKIEFPEFYFMDGSKDFYVDSEHEARNARIQVDGFPIEAASNEIPDFLPGVNLQLKQAKPDQPFTLSITQDVQKISGKMKGVVDQLNGVLQFIVKQNAIDESTDTRTSFAGDSSLQSIEYRLRNLMHEGFKVGVKENGEPRIVFLSELGVEFDKAGALTFKEEKFNKAVEKSFETVAEAVSGGFGFGYQLKEVVAGYTRAGNGVLTTKEQGIRNRIKDIDKQIDTKQKMVDKKSQALVEQFARLQSSLSNMQKQQQYLSATLGSGGGNNMVSQLLGGG